MKTLTYLAVFFLALLGVTRDAPTEAAGGVPGQVVTHLLRARVLRELNAMPAVTGFFARHLPTGREIAIRADRPMNTASVIKIPIMVQAIRDAEAGLFDLDERHTITPDDLRRGTGLIQTFAIGLQPTFGDLNRQMITTSDNVGTDLVLGRVTRERVNALMQQLGLGQTRVNLSTAELARAFFVAADPANASLTDREIYERGTPDVSPERLREIAREVARDPADWLGATTAREMSLLLEQIWNGSLASPDGTEQMKGILGGQLFATRLPRLIAEEAEVAHKTGDFSPFILNDVGVIEYDGGPVVVSVFVNENRGRALPVEEGIGRIARDLIRLWK